MSVAIKISNNKELAKQYESLCESKISAYNELLEHIKQFVKVNDIDFTKSNLFDEITTKIVSKYRAEFPPIVKNEKIVDLIGLEPHKLQTLISSFNSIDVEFDHKTKKCKELDFSIYTDNKIQAEEWFNLCNLCDELNSRIDKIVEGVIPRTQLAQMFKNVIQYDYNQFRFKPNIRHIKSLK